VVVGACRIKYSDVVSMNDDFMAVGGTNKSIFYKAGRNDHDQQIGIPVHAYPLVPGTSTVRK